MTLTVTAQSGSVVQGDIIEIFYVHLDGGGVGSIGSVEVTKDVQWTTVTLTFNADEIGDSETVIVHVERDGTVIADTETTLTNETIAIDGTETNPSEEESDDTESEEETEEEESPEVEIEDVIAEEDEIVLTFSEDVEVGSRRSTLRNLELTNEDGDEVAIDDVESDNGDLIVITEEDLEPGEYTVVYNGRSGLEVDGNDLDEFEAEFTVEGDIEIEDIVAEEDEIVLTFSEDIEVGSRRSTLRNLELTNEDGDEVAIDDVEADGIDLIVITEEDLEPGEYTLVYNGRSGLEVDGNDLDEFEAEFTVEGETEETTEEDPACETFWVSITTGVLTEDGSVVTGTLDAEGISVTDWARGVIEGPSWRVGGEEEVKLCIVTEEELGLSGSYTIGQLKIAAYDAGYRLVPAEVAVLARFFYKDQPSDEHLLFLSNPLQYQGERPHARGHGESVRQAGRRLASRTPVLERQ